MSGICSTPSLAYENSPSTHSATITMHGEDRVVDRDAGDPHDRPPQRECCQRGAGCDAAAGEPTPRARRRPRPATTSALRTFAQVVEARRQHLAGRRHAAAAPRHGLRARRAGPRSPRGAPARRSRSARHGPGPTVLPTAVTGSVSRCCVVGQHGAGHRVLAGAQEPPRVGEFDRHADRSACPARPPARCARSRPSTGAPTPSTRTSHRHAGREPRDLVRADAAGQFEPAPGRRSSAPAARRPTFSPGSAWRLATMPAIGATSVASRIADAHGVERRLRSIQLRRARCRARRASCPARSAR